MTYFTDQQWKAIRPPQGEHGAPFDVTGLTGDYLKAWQMDHPGQTYMTQQQWDAYDQSRGGGGYAPSGAFETIMGMRRPVKKKRNEQLQALLAQMTGQSAFAQNPSMSVYGGSPMTSIFGTVG